MHLEQHKLLREIFDTAVHAVAPDAAVQSHVKLMGNDLHVDGRSYSLENKKILVLGAGKGVAPMAKAIEDMLGERINDGLVVTKYEHTLPLKYIKIMEAAHPVPDSAGLNATKAIMEKAMKADADTLVLCLFTGGASALTPSLAQGLELFHVQEVTSQLLKSGATIQQINALRKHLSSFSGGQLARMALPAEVLTLIVSDVIGDELDVIASGPTAPDASTFSQCIEIVKKFGLEKSLPPVVYEYLLKGAQGKILETPKADDVLFEHVHNVLVATNTEALTAARHCAENLGFEVHILPEPMRGEAKVQALNLVNKAKGVAKQMSASSKPVCLLAGGETTVTISGQGKGGRNQEMALSAAFELEGFDNIAALFAGTDGTDGPTDAAGGFALSNSVDKMCKVCNPKELLADNNSYKALTLGGDILITGPTRTNVMDLAILLVWPNAH